MTIQINTDKIIDWHQRHQDHFTTLIEKELSKFKDYITRVEVHLSDENGAKKGVDDIKCLMEVRVEGKKPIAVSSKADTLAISFAETIKKVDSSLRKLLDKK